MNVLIIGGGGFLGQKLARRLATAGRLRGRDITGMTLADIAAPDPVAAPFAVETTACDITDRAAVDGLLAQRFDVIFLLAAVVSSQAEAEFEVGLQVNLHGALNVLEAARLSDTTPVLVFTSSLAVFGGDVPDPIRDWTIPNPQTSYGTQKAMTMPGRTLTIRQMIDAMTAVAGPEPAKLIRFEDDPAIRDIVTGWRFDYDPAKALALGLQADAGFEDNVRYYLEDDRPV
ncbi:MAG: NAD-dependent epimerase/dehydratase family protein [Loktanella sp.]|nr:NAD-dependent epimerase/dehydratase family protein [Loktanella sp.]